MMEDPIFASEQPADERAMRRATQREDDDLRALLETPHGVRFVRRLLGQGRLFQSSFAADPLTTAFQEGQRNQALAVLAMVTEAAPSRVAEILTEEPE